MASAGMARFTFPDSQVRCAAMPEEADPPRKFYRLKPRPYEVLNPPVPAPPAPTHAAPPPARIEVTQLVQQATTPGTVLPPSRTPAARNDVHAILEGNLERANAAGLNDLVYQPKRRSKRRRDYFTVVIPLNAVFAFIAFGPYSNTATMAYGAAGIIIVTLGLGWVMFFVMDDY